jgi:hypothetical protein
MTSRKVKYKPGEFIVPCPKCKNNTQFTVHSAQVCEDGCEIWAVCKCGYNPSSHENMGSGYRVEDVWGGCSDDNCQDAILYSWNDPIEDQKNKISKKQIN